MTTLTLFGFVFALFMWWFSTGLVLYLNHLRASRHRWILLLSSGLAIACLIGVVDTAGDATVRGALLAFTQALVIWAWLEMSYFMGLLTGPRKLPCPDDCRGRQRFALALQTSLHHELAVLALGIILLVLTWGTPNPVAAATYVTLWIMRWSAKLNLYFGVANFHAEWLPMNLRYLASYVRVRPMNAFFPVAVTLATLLVGFLIREALTIDDPFLEIAHVLIASLLGLAILEHWFLVLPLRDSLLWDWVLRVSKKSVNGTAQSGPSTRLLAPAASDRRHAVAACWGNRAER